jgi:hypothetical protein
MLHSWKYTALIYAANVFYSVCLMPQQSTLLSVSSDLHVHMHMSHLEAFHYSQTDVTFLPEMQCAFSGNIYDSTLFFFARPMF